MKQESPGSRPRGDSARRRPGWGVALGFILAAWLGKSIRLTIVAMTGSAWL